MASAASSTLYRTIWRWHFYAGLLVIPFVVLLSLSGAVYLFKPQVDRWEERAFHGQPLTPAAVPHKQVEAALARYAGASFLDYRLPERAGDSAMVRLALAGDGALREVFVSPRGDLLGALDPDRRVMAVVKRIHSQLLLGGNAANLLVELAACWAIVMIVSGLYLWWPRGRGPAGTVWPRLKRGKRVFWRDLHAVTGFWVSSLALVLLVSGLPWTSVWGSAFGAVRAEMGWINGPAQWEIDGIPPMMPSAGHHGLHHAALPARQARLPFDPVVFDQMVHDAIGEALAFPAIVTPPGAPGRFGSKGEPVWTIRSDAANRTARTTIQYDMAGHGEVWRETFADTHPIDRVVGYGVAWHEGQLFGLANQLIGLVTALALIMVAISGTVMWVRRRPRGMLGAPPSTALAPRPKALAGIICILALLMPLFALSVTVIWLAEFLVLRRIGPLATWLGLATPHEQRKLA